VDKKINTDNPLTEAVMDAVEYVKSFKEELRTQYSVPFMKKIKRGK